MAGHSQFKNIMHRKGAQDAKRAKLFTKLIKEIIVSVKTGQVDPNFNPRLRAAISAARANNLPKDRIDNAIKKGSSSTDTDNYEEIRYEGYGNGGIAIIVEALTDNRNRTASEVRAAFNKYAGNLGETGSVNFMFDRIGSIIYNKSVASDEQILEDAIEFGADDCRSDEFAHQIITSLENFNKIREEMATKYGDAEVARFDWIPLNLIDIDKEKGETLMKLLDMLEDNDDVQYVCCNANFL